MWSIWLSLGVDVFRWNAIITITIISSLSPSRLCRHLVFFIVSSLSSSRLYHHHVCVTVSSLSSYRLYYHHVFVTISSFSSSHPFIITSLSPSRLYHHHVFVTISSFSSSRLYHHHTFVTISSFSLFRLYRHQVFDVISSFSSPRLYPHHVSVPTATEILRIASPAGVTWSMSISNKTLPTVNGQLDSYLALQKDSGHYLLTVNKTLDIEDIYDKLVRARQGLTD